MSTTIYSGAGVGVNTSAGKCSRCGQMRACVRFDNFIMGRHDEVASALFCTLMCWPNLIDAISEGRELDAFEPEEPEPKKKRVTLRGQPWNVWDDGYRFWIEPADGNPLIDREPRSVLSYKHDDSPAAELAGLFFALLPNTP